MPAKAGTQGNKRRAFGTWTPAFAGATMGSIREASVWFRPLVFSQTHTLLANMAGLVPAMAISEPQSRIVRYRQLDRGILLHQRSPILAARRNAWGG